MWKYLLLVVVALMLCHSDVAQAQGAIKKFPGEAITFGWTYSASDQANATGFRLYSGTTPTGPFTFTGVTVTPSSSLTGTVSATFATGSVITYYTVRAYFTGTNPPATVESVDSNAVEVDRNVVTPTALQGK